MNEVVYFSNGKIWYIRAKSIYIKITQNIFVIFLYPSMCGVSFDILFLLNSFVESLPIVMTCIKNMHFLSLFQKMFLLGINRSVAKGETARCIFITNQWLLCCAECNAILVQLFGDG